MTGNSNKDLACRGVTKLNANGQVPIPAEVRKELGWTAGSEVMIFFGSAPRRLVITDKPLDEELVALAMRSASLQSS